MWKTLEQDFPQYHVINRGFGGSQISNSFISLSHRDSLPAARDCFHAGGNDINAGKSAETVFNDFEMFVTKVREKLPRTKIAYISIAPNPARWSQLDRIREANRLIHDYTAKHAGLSFIDVFLPMLGSDGQPKAGIYLDDKLHMNARGYAIWTRVVGEHLKSMVRPGGPETRP